jgi:hypothetical protein
MITDIGTMKQTLGKFIINLYVSIRKSILRFQERRIRMKKEDLGNILATQLIECVSNRKYGYISSVGSSYSHLNEEGKVLMAELIERMVPIAHTIHEKDTKNRAEQLMMDTLKNGS